MKTKFVAEGEEYVLQEEDVSGLKTNKADLLKELKELKEKYGDLDPDARPDERDREEGERAEREEQRELHIGVQ